MYAVRRLSLITKFHHLDVEAGEWQGRTRAVDAHGPIGEARVTATWNARSFGVVGGLKARQDHQCSTPANRARSPFGVLKKYQEKSNRGRVCRSVPAWKPSMESRESGNPKGKTKELAAIQNAVKLKVLSGLASRY